MLEQICTLFIIFLMVLGTDCIFQLTVQLAMLACIIFGIWNAGQNLGAHTWANPGWG